MCSIVVLVCTYKKGAGAVCSAADAAEPGCSPAAWWRERTRAALKCRASLGGQETTREIPTPGLPFSPRKTRNDVRLKMCLPRRSGEGPRAAPHDPPDWARVVPAESMSLPSRLTKPRNLPSKLLGKLSYAQLFEISPCARGRFSIYLPLPPPG